MSNPDEPRDGFLTRWSRRKREGVGGVAEDVRAQDATPHASSTDAVLSSGEALPLSEGDVEEPFDLTSLPSLDDLTGESNLAVFMQKGVPDALKNAALRKVWSADPFIRDHIGPADYAWDFNNPASIPGFGEIGLVDTDVAAMLRDIVGVPDPVKEAPIAVAPEGEIADVQADIGAHAGLSEAKDQHLSSYPDGTISDTGEAEANAVAGNSALVFPLDEADALRAIVLRQTHNVGAYGAEASSDFKPVAPRKRHGGAIPS